MRVHPVVASVGLAALASLALGCSSPKDGADGERKPMVLESEHFVVQPGEEKTMCQVIYANNAPMDFRHISSRMVSGSHHLILFRHLSLPLEGFETPAEGLQECQMEGPRLYVYGAQEAIHEVQLPDRIGGRLDENEIFILEIHIANASAEAIDAFATVTIDPAPADSIDEYSGILFYMNTDFAIPAGAGIDGAPVHSDAATCAVPRDVNVFRMQSHAHKRMTKAEAWLTDASGFDAQKIYKNEDWHAPVSRSFDDPALSIAGGQNIEFECSWSNETDQVIEFGESVEDEMCIVGLGYYPRIEYDGTGTVPIDMHGNVFCVDGELYY